MPRRRSNSPVRSPLPGSPFLVSVGLHQDRVQPGVLQLEGGMIQSVSYHETEHYQVTRDFLNAPERFYRHLFESDESED